MLSALWFRQLWWFKFGFRPVQHSKPQLFSGWCSHRTREVTQMMRSEGEDQSLSVV
jgi:hypothetical protein